MVSVGGDLLTFPSKNVVKGAIAVEPRLSTVQVSGEKFENLVKIVIGLKI